MDPGSALIGGVSILLLTIAAVQLIKSTFEPPAKVLPFITLGVAVTLSFTAWAVNIWPVLRGPVETAIMGIVIGLTAMGSWSGTKAASGK